MAMSHVLSALTQKHSELQGEIQRLEQQLEYLNHGLDGIETSILVFEPDFNLSKIKAKRRNNKTVGLKRGEIPMLVGNYVRLADKDFIANDVIEYVFGQKPSLDKTKYSDNVKHSVTQALYRLQHRNTIVEVGRSYEKGSPIIWRSAS